MKSGMRTKEKKERGLTIAKFNNSCDQKIKSGGINDNIIK